MRAQSYPILKPRTLWDRMAPALWVVMVLAIFTGAGFALAFWWLSEMFRGALP